MRIGLIGIGKIANYQMQAITHTRGITLVDAHDLDPTRADELPGSVKFHDDLDKMLARSTAEAFLVSTPTSSHFEVAMKVISAGRIAVVEKPLCTSLREMEMLLAAARTQKLPLFTTFHPAFGREVEWWVEQRAERNFELGRLLAFESCFADPYYLEGKLTLASVGKAGAWLDSGISSLSVLARLIPPADLSLIEGRMTVVPGLGCHQLQGLGLFRFQSEGRPGFGLIDTNWTLGRSCKNTRLWYEGGIVELDHGREVGILKQEGEEDLLFSLATDRPRLVNHYCGVFSDLLQRIQAKEDNKATSEALHRLLFAALGQ